MFSNKKFIFLFYSLIIFSFLIIIQYINIQKILLRNEPISFYDFYLLKETIFILKESLEFHILKMFYIALIFALMTLGLLFFINKISFFKQKILNKILGSISFIVLVFNFYPIQEEINWDALSFYQSNGFLKYLNYQIILLYSSRKPSKYSYEKIKKIIKKIPDHKNTYDSIQPDVVLILNESFWDPLIIEKLQLNKDPSAIIET